MNSANVLVKRAAIAATVTSSVFAFPSAASAHFTSDGLLHKGMNHKDVKTLQTILKSTGDYKLLKPTGYFGSSTDKAVRQFQTKNGLKADGLVGPLTKLALTAADRSHTELLSEGSKNADVRFVQNHLKKMGFYRGNIDSIFGPLTKDGVIRFQKKNQITVDGIVGPETYRTLLKVLEHKDSRQSSRPAAAPKKKPVGAKAHQVSQPAHRAKVVNTVKEFYANSTAYTASCSGCSGITATGLNLVKNPNAKVVAVDPSVIPLGTKLYIDGYGYAVAADTGGSIRGQRIDLFFKDNSDALKWGRRTVKVKVLD